MTDTSPSTPPAATGAADGFVRSLQILRVPVALGLLALVAQPRDDLMLVRMGLYAPDTSFAAVWARITLAALAFALVVLVARRRTAPLSLLAVEAIVAGALGFVPPFRWGSWLDHHPVSRALDFEFVAPLAIAWFAVAVTTIVARRREAAPTGTRIRASARADRSWLGRIPASSLQWLRLPALLVSLVLVGQQRDELARASLGAGTYELVWVQMTLPALAFVLIALVGRRHRTPWPLLAVETVLAAALAFTPPHRWFGWLNWDELAHVLFFEFIPPLAIAWLAIAVLTAVRQRADSHEARAHRRHAGHRGQWSPLRMLITSHKPSTEATTKNASARGG